MPTPFEINGASVAPGQRQTIDLPVAKLYTHTTLAIPVHVINGRRPGPRLFVSAAIHGDELNGVEIIRRLLKHPGMKSLRGTLVAIPVVNVHGFLERSRYLPDRRDLNRSFPGSDRGSLASRVARLFVDEIVCKCTHGIDLHTGAVHRNNLPQVRANLDDAETQRLAEAFATPVLINSSLRDGSLREAAVELGIPMLLFEGGEALRFDEVAIRAGVRGILNVMRELNMLSPARKRKHPIVPVVARSSSWIRAPESGILRAVVPIGAKVGKGDLLGVISDPFGERDREIISEHDGIIIGRSLLPLVHEGEALFNLARFQKGGMEDVSVEEFQAHFEPEPGYPAEADGPIV